VRNLVRNLRKVVRNLMRNLEKFVRNLVRNLTKFVRNLTDFGPSVKSGCATLPSL
jgi:hypothetical protein